MADQTAPVDYRQTPALHPVHRAHQLDLRLPDVLSDALRLQVLGQPVPFPYRLVRRVTLYPDPDHPCHSHQQDSVPPKPGELATDCDFPGHRCRWRMADGFAAGKYAWVRPAASKLLAVPGCHAAELRAADPSGEDLVCSQVW